ncbi:probable cytochrome P450 6a23 [Anthonomus grandis grandis]|uniref:probable cytochrome P450 6a23 n=1 Tax=Anthonomus grandis grandis TaxID=2921223 RepID=UPI0021667864|nr:probable cytochrome P450 6a23 [Anthonomus grandis grandis]
MSNIFIWYFILSFLTVVTSLIFWIKHRQNFWKRQGIYQINPDFFFGNLKGIFFQKKALGETFLDIYKEIKTKDGKHGGLYVFLAPYYMPVDPAIIKQITVKDFNYFMNHGTYFDEKNDPLSGVLFNIEGHRWRTLRANLTPTFTSGKIKNMYKIVLDCTENLAELLLKTISTEQKRPIDIKDIISRYSIDIIGNCAFGFFLNMVKNTVTYRERTQYFRPDFMHLLLQLKNLGKVTDEKTILASNESQHKPLLTLNELAAQCFIFFFAGFETSATTITFALFELARNQGIQEKLRTEIHTIWETYGNSYETLMKMTYLEKVICETLRKYPPVPCTNRIANATYKIPNSKLTLNKGTNVVIPILGIHMDPEYYPEPTKFDPERFSEEAKALRPGCTWLPFGEGPRSCIGSRFGLLESKIAVATIIHNFYISLSDSTKLPLEMDPGTLINSSKGKIWLNIQKV